MNNGEVNLVEVFSSIQGEGPYVGFRQIFVRFTGCNLRCAYCDTSFISTEKFPVELVPGSGQFTYFANPIEANQLANILEPLYNSAHSISLTGGEPLLHADFIRDLREQVKSKSPFYLETNGTLVDELAQVIDDVDIISMDMKLPSVYHDVELWDRHQEFLRIGSAKEIFVKIVVGSDTCEQELDKVCDIIENVNTSIPLIIQPVSPNKNFPGQPPGVKRLLDIQERALKVLHDVRVIPQCHKFIGCL